MSITNCPYPLLDAPEDGAIEERGWVPKAVVATPDEAVVWLLRQVGYATEWINEEGLVLAATGTTSWHRQSACLTCEGSRCGGLPRVGSWPGVVAAGPPEACDSCDGTGEQWDDGDYIAWERCEADDDGAVEFWDLEVVESV